ncbi:MAG: hypothetical protein EON47_08865, partial [Acetobacteraceae bacterium]
MPMTKTMLGQLSLLLMAIGFAALLAAGGGLVWLVETTRTFASGVSQTQDVRLAAGQVLSLIQGAETSQRGYLLTGEESYLEPYHAAVIALPRELPELARLITADGGQPAPPQLLKDLVTAKLEELGQTIALAEAGDRAAALAIVRTDRGKVSMDAIREVVHGIEARSTRRLALRSEGLDRSGRMLLLGAAGALVLMLGVTTATSRWAASSSRV